MVDNGIIEEAIPAQVRHPTTEYLLSLAEHRVTGILLYML